MYLYIRDPKPQSSWPGQARTNPAMTMVVSHASSLIQPDVGQILVHVVARPDLPALHVAVMRDLPVPPGHHQRMHLGAQHLGLVLPHQAALLGGVGLMRS